MRYQYIDDEILDLAYRQIITDRETDKSIKTFKLYTRIKFEWNRRKAVRAAS